MIENYFNNNNEEVIGLMNLTQLVRTKHNICKV